MIGRYIVSIIIVFIIGIFMIGTQAVDGANETYQHGLDGKNCTDCHTDHVVEQTITTPKIVTSKIGVANVGIANIGVTSTTNVIGNITLIASMGQDWYQQGIYGPSGYNTAVDQSWGWTFFDENPPSGYITPSEKVIQRDNIYTLLLDDGNNSNPISGATIIANVTYWKYNGTSYTSNISSVRLTEDINRRGFYSGRFDFYGGTTYKGYGMKNCDGCHVSIFHGPDTLAGYFPGNYTVLIKAEADNKITAEDINFEVTPWGCEDCHGSGNRHRSSAPDRHIVTADMDSACYLCHSVNDVSGMYDAGNPHQNTAHRNLNCVDCHSNKGLSSQTFNGVTFVNGGINNAPLPQYNYRVIPLNGGTHLNLSCKDCHNNLVLSNPQGGYKSDNYTVNDTINKYDPNFTTIRQFQDYYVVNVTEGGSLNIYFNWEGTSNLGFYLYPPNFNPRNFTNLPLYDGSNFTNKPERYVNSVPTPGKWVLQIYGYNLLRNWTGEIQPPINYTINSTYPIQRKDLPSTPECNNCHNSEATDGAYTRYEIPNWNPGYAHADINKDGTLDIQCRMCHDSMHNIGIKKCQDCHTKAPTGHIITGSAYDQYSTAQCLQCHGDPHKVSAQAEQCTECHGTNYTGAVPSVDSTFVDINVFDNSVHQNVNKTPIDTVNNNDCWSCHFNKDMNMQNIRKCNYCHSKPSQWHGSTNVTTNLTELAIR